MPKTVKVEHTTTHHHARESSFVSLLSGWVQQGVENFFATQRILVDLAVRQNSSAMNFVRDRLADSASLPTGVLTELAGEGMTNFIEGQKLLLNLAQKEYEIVTTGVKERVGAVPAAVALTELMGRSFDTFVEMQQDFLKIASKQTHHWLAVVKSEKDFDGEEVVEMARDSFDTFVRAQKKFLDVVAEETVKVTGGDHNGATKKVKKTELTELARQATESFIDAQKKLMDVAGKQVNAQMKATDRTLNMFSSLPVIPLPKLTRESVQDFVDTEKAVIDTITKRHHEPKKTAKTVRGKRVHHPIKVTVHAGA